MTLPQLINCVPNPAKQSGECLLDHQAGTSVALRLNWIPSSIPTQIIEVNPPPWASFTVPDNATGLLIEDLSGQSADLVVTINPA